MTANGFNSIFGPNPSSAGMLGAGAGTGDSASVGSGNKSGYFRVCGVVPAVRDEAREKAVRKARRVEVNALIVRMAVGSVGGRVGGGSMNPTTGNGGVGNAKGGKNKKDAEEKKEAGAALVVETTELDPDKMTDDWSRRILDWPSARRLADRALACAVLASPGPNSAGTETSSKGSVDTTLKSDGAEPSALLEVSEQTSSGVLIPASASISPSASDSTPSRASSTPEVGLPTPTAVPWEAVRAAWDALWLTLGYGQEATTKIDKDKTDDSSATADSASTAPPAAAAPAPIPDPATPTSPPKWSGIGSPREPVPWLDAALHQEPVIGIGKPPEPGQADEVVERVKSDPELETHEERLLGCIVNPGMLSPNLFIHDLTQHTL